MAATIYALSSGRPPAAIAVIRVSGPKAHEAGTALAGELPGVREAGVRALRDPATGALLDEALVLRFDAPQTATGENVVEFHCHGSRAVVDAVLGVLQAMEGLREAMPGEFTRRAFENGRIDLTEAEGLADLLEAETESQRRAALLMADGGLRRQIDEWQRVLVELSARAERAIDYADEGGGDDEEQIAISATELAAELDEWLGRPRAEPLRDGIKVVVAGPPNAGKSSLINAIAGSDRIIVSDIPGTTRDVVEVPLSLSGIPFLFADTAGLREAEDRIDALGIGRASDQIERADILLWLGDPAAAPAHDVRVLIHAKADLKPEVPAGSLAVSAMTGAGLKQLLDKLVELSKRLLPVDGAIALNRRQAETIQAMRGFLAEVGSADDIAIKANAVRGALSALDRLTGRAGVEDMLDALFSRFCLGK